MAPKTCMRAVTVLSLLGVPLASAEILDASQFMSIQVSNSSGSGTYSVPVADASQQSDSLDWQMAPGPIVITDDVSGAPIATLAASSFSIISEPRARVEFSFSLLAGSEDTLVEAQAPQLNVGGLSGIQARSSISFDLTDGGDGFASMTSAATPLGIGAFRGRYNGAGDAGTMFSHSIYQMQISNGPGSTLNTNKNFPNFGFATIGDTVEDLSVDMSFTLTEGDLLTASGSMELSVEAPEPGTIMLLLSGVAGLLRRR